MLSIKSKKILKVLFGLTLGLIIFIFNTPSIAVEPPSKQFINKDIYIGSIFFEWYKKNHKIPVYACVCLKSECDKSQSWPFRRFPLGGVLPALGSYNKNFTESLGFKCYEVESKEFLEGIGD